MKTQVVAALALAAGCAQAFVAPRVGLNTPVAQQARCVRRASLTRNPIGRKTVVAARWCMNSHIWRHPTSHTHTHRKGAAATTMKAGPYKVDLTGKVSLL
jgi:hypothetical protein